jgi:predicted esterase
MIKTNTLKHTFEFTKTFRYFTHGNMENSEVLLFVLHGYGQLAEYFIKKFEHLDESILVVAPEGMHRFYTQGSSGRVGASWMTKEDRESDINDNLHFLNHLEKLIRRKKKFRKKILIGFSQGGATAARWHYNNPHLFDSLVMWGSVFPPDLSLNKEINTEGKSNYFILGDKDEYFNVSDREIAIEHFRSKNFQIILYNGKHDICSGTVLHLMHEVVK